MFPKQISKEELKKYPLERYEGIIELVDQTHQVEHAIKQIQSEIIIGVDTETKPSFKKGVSHNTSLLQIATSEKVFLFRLNKIGLPKSLCSILRSKEITKVGIAVLQDMKELRQQFRPFESNEVIDLNVLCPTMGFENIGAKNLSAMVLGFTISKRQQTSNWENNSLTEAQIRYAATDAWICREIYLKLMQQ